jgi:hypothetical protein
MAITLSTGATISVAKTYGPVVTVTAATNAAECVLTTGAAHSIAVGDYVEVRSGWGLLDQRVVRAKTGTTGSTLVLEGVNTTDVVKYPAGAGIGSVRRITAWTQITQVRSISASGGEQQYADITSLVDVVTRQAPTVRGAINMTAEVFDDPTLDWYADVGLADDSRTPFGMLMSFPNNSKLVANAYWSLMRVPMIAQNEALMTQITLSYAAEPLRYAS